jgi:hypothetical protein
MNSQPSPHNPRHSIHLHIEELVLHGFAPSDRYVVAEAVERELARLVTARGISSQFTQKNSVEKLDGGSFKMVPGARADAVGVRVTQAVHGGLSR